jgi:ribonuclease Z
VAPPETSVFMSVREFIALGTGSQVPTRRRNHNGYFLRWDDEGFLFDPGEGTQRQMAYGDLAASRIHRIFITHFHGDHCLGLAGVIQRLSLDRCDHPVTVHYPASGEEFFQRLRFASIYHPCVDLVPAPHRVPDDGLHCIARTEKYSVFAHRLDHPVPTYGYRIEEHGGRRFVPELLREHGVSGALVGELSRAGKVTVGDRVVAVEDVSVARYGSAVAFVMDTRVCPGAVALARDADLLVMEATYTAEDQRLADEHSHASAVDAARTALDAGAHHLAMTHFSQRYDDTAQHVREALAVFPRVTALDDLSRVTVPRRR